MTPAKEPLQILWDNILSRKPARIRRTFNQLDDVSRRELLAHLNRMVSENGWHPEQVKSAQAALNVLQPVED